jgi:16S rRNA processing protein RimM
MELDDCFEIGFIIKPHGLKGAVNIQLDVDDPSKYNKTESVIVKMGNNLVPFFISSIQIQGNKGILSLKDIHTIEEAEELKSCPLLLPLKLLPKLKKDQFYYHEVIGYHIQDDKLGALGTIESVFTAGSQDLISMAYQGKEVLIPVNNEIVLKADHDTQEVFVSLPDGLLEIYLKD